MASITYGNLRARILDAADMAGSDFPDTTSSGNPLKQTINSSIAALYDLLLDLGWTNQFIRKGTVTVTTSTDEFAAPTDCYKPIRLMFEDTDGTWYDLGKFDIGELPDNHIGGATVTNNYDLRWAPWSTYATSTFTAAIKFDYNPPSTSGTFRLYYVPYPTVIGASDSNVFPFIVPPSWEDWVVYDVAAHLLRREESDASTVEAKRAEVEHRIRVAAKDKVHANTYRMRDIHRRWR